MVNASKSLDEVGGGRREKGGGDREGKQSFLDKNSAVHAAHQLTAELRSIPEVSKR